MQAKSMRTYQLSPTHADPQPPTQVSKFSCDDAATSRCPICGNFHTYEDTMNKQCSEGAALNSSRK